MPQRLRWFAEGDFRWTAGALRAIGCRSQITVREFEDGRVFDVQRLTRTDRNASQPSYIGSATTLERAQAIAQANHAPAPNLGQRPADRARSASEVGAVRPQQKDRSEGRPVQS